MGNRRLLAAGLVLVAAGLVGMTIQPSAGGWWGMPMGAMMGWWQSEDTPQTPAVAGAPTVEIEASEFVFQPDPLVIDAGDTVNLTLVNTGTLVHDLTIPKLDVHLVVWPGQASTTAVTVTEAGEYQMLCTVPGHAEAGMTGMIVVETP